MTSLYIRDGFTLLLLGLRRVFSTKLTALYFISDYVLQVLVFLIIGFVSGSSGYWDSRNLAWRYWPWYLVQWGFVWVTWSYGYNAINQDTPRRHLRIATVRLAFCCVSVCYFVYDRIVVQHQQTPVNTFFLFAIVLSAVCHHRGANKRLWQYQIQHEAGKTNASDRAIDAMTGLRRRYVTPQEREVLQEKSAKFMTTNMEGNDQFWYHPFVPIENSKESVVGTDYESSLFSRCYCCLDSDPYAQVQSGADLEEQRKLTEWDHQRTIFLDQPLQSHRSGLLAAGLSADCVPFKPHVLCDKCSWMCSTSYFIALQRGWTSQTFWKYISHTFSREPMIEETFEHCLSAVELQRQSDQGCHLCSLMWNSMSEEQQGELLSQDERLALELEAALANLQEDEANIVKRKRAVRVKIQSPWAQTQWTSPWKSRHTFDALRLIPHFGEQQLARRWMKKKFASCLVSIGDDPTLDWDQEHVDAIELRATKLKNQGPVMLPLSYSTNTDITMSFITTWLQDHDHLETIRAEAEFRDDDANNHDDDVLLDFRVLDDGFLPSRLIHVGHDDSSIRLCISTEIRLTSEQSTSHGLGKADNAYVALSHCWGSTPHFITLTQSTLATFRRRIPYDSLTATFRDAILVTRKLGLRFIWIDSLCIIQDSLEMEDWCREAPTMKDVYSNAYLVLAAAGSWDSSHSLFAQQKPLNMSPCLVATKGHLSGLTGYSPNSFGAVYAFPSNKFTKNARQDLRSSRLRTRGWCFQEEALAKRIVYFGDHQIILYCRDPCDEFEQQVDWPGAGSNGWDLDRYPKLIHTDIFWTTVTVMKKALASYLGQNSPIQFMQQWKSRKPAMMTSINKPKMPSTPYRDEEDIQVLLKHEWWTEVLKYSSRFLSKERDKLEALAGIASKYQLKALKQRENTKYLAGLWEPYLALGLLWYVSRNRQGRSGKVYRAPSWSWAAVDGIIENNSLDGGESFESSCITILEVEVIGSGMGDEPDVRFPLGAVSGGFLKVLGCVRKATWKSPPHQERIFYVGHNPRDKPPRDESELAPYVSISNDSTSGPAALSLHAHSGEQVGYLVPDAEEDIPDELYCLKIVVQPETRVGKEDFNIPWATRGLALARENDVSNRYRRLGYIEINRTHGGVSIPGTFSQPWKATLKSHNARAIRSPPPDLDVNGFFKDIEATEIVIF